jgi:hypothetical protein
MDGSIPNRVVVLFGFHVDPIWSGREGDFARLPLAWSFAQHYPSGSRGRWGRQICTRSQRIDLAIAFPRIDPLNVVTIDALDVRSFSLAADLPARDNVEANAVADSDVRNASPLERSTVAEDFGVSLVVWHN